MEELFGLTPEEAAEVLAERVRSKVDREAKMEQVLQQLVTDAQGRYSKLNGLPKFHRIPGFPTDIMAMITLSEKGQVCTKCGKVFETDEPIWLCDRLWLGTRSHGHWCFTCLDGPK